MPNDHKTPERPPAKPEEHSSAAVVARGQQAIEAHYRAMGKDMDTADCKKEEEEDAAQWRNEG